jgi:hypothetical protein
MLFRGLRGLMITCLSLLMPRVAAVRSDMFHLSTYRCNSPRLASPQFSSMIRPSYTDTFSLAILAAGPVGRTRVWPREPLAGAAAAVTAAESCLVETSAPFWEAFRGQAEAY